MSRPWMPLYVGDYLKKTRHLTAAQHGAYLLLIMTYWEAGGLPDDDVQIQRLAAMSDREWKEGRNVIAAFFEKGWHHPRIESEMAIAEEKYQKRAIAGGKGGRARSAKRPRLVKP